MSFIFEAISGGDDSAWVQPGETLDLSAYLRGKLAIRANRDAAQGRVKLQLGNGQPVERDRIPYSISIPTDWTGGIPRHCQN